MSERIAYVVTSGEYSDYGINGVFSTRALADAFVAAFPRADMGVEEWDLDPIDLSDGRLGYFVRLKPDTGDVLECYQDSSAYGFDRKEHGRDVNGNWYYQVFARDEQHAIKIANERRLMERAS